MDYTDLEKIKRRLQRELSPRTYAHSLRTAETALELQKRFGGDAGIVETAALLHDCGKTAAKNPAPELQKRFAAFLAYPAVLHAPLGAYLAEKEYGIADPKVLSAIACHTTGKPGMTIEEKIVFLADGIEPGREYPGVAQLRELARKDLDGAILAYLERTAEYLWEKGEKLHSDTALTIKDLKEKKV